MIKVWSWRQAIQLADIPPTTKLVLFNLSVYMNEKGESCYPSITQQEKDTGLSRRAIISHLQKAQEAGFITITKQKFKGQDWIHNSYIATYPPNIGELGAPPLADGGAGGSPKVVHEVHTNSPVNTPYRINDYPPEKAKEMYYDGLVIKLTFRDYFNWWRGIFPMIEDEDTFYAILEDRDNWLAGSKCPATTRAQWFITTQKHFKKIAKDMV